MWLDDLCRSVLLLKWFTISLVKKDSYSVHGDINLYQEPVAEIGELQLVVTGI